MNSLPSLECKRGGDGHPPSGEHTGLDVFDLVYVLEPRGGDKVSQVIACGTMGDGSLEDAARDGHSLRLPVMMKFVGEAREEISTGSQDS